MGTINDVLNTMHRTETLQGPIRDRRCSDETCKSRNGAGRRGNRILEVYVTNRQDDCTVVNDSIREQLRVLLLIIYE